MSNKEKFELIEKTISEVSSNVSISRLIQDCADKLSLSVKDVEDTLKEFNSSLLVKTI